MYALTHGRTCSILLIVAAALLSSPGVAQPQPIPFGVLAAAGPIDAGPHSNQDDCPVPLASAGRFRGPSAPSNVIYVDRDAIGNNHGRCWTHAFVDLQLALAEAAARMTAVEIWVAEGVYTPDLGTGDVNAAFELREDVAIYGGFRGHETARRQRNANPATNGTVLSGLIDAAIDPPARSMHVVLSIANTRSAVLDGFRIEGGAAGDAAVPGDPGGDPNGGGLQLLGSSAIIRNCRFVGHTALGLGGAVYIDGGSPLLQNNWFEANAAEHGGAVAVVGAATPMIRHCTFFDNSAVGQGGAVYTANAAAGCISGGMFVANVAVSGGGLHHADGSGPVVVNCLFNGNEALLGGAITHADASKSLLLNATITANRAATGSGVAYLSGDAARTRNSILWGNTDLLGLGGPQWHTNQDGDEPDIAYSLVQGGAAGPGNLSVNPRFRDANGADDVFGTLDDDLRLAGNSPCIDAADNTAWSVGGIAGEGAALDLDQQPRFVDDPQTADTGVGPPPIVDMGPYEFNRAVAAAPVDPAGG